MNDAESNLLLVRRYMIILKYDPILAIYSIGIALTRMTVETKDTTLVLRSISYNMADELANPVCTNPLVCIKFMNQFDYNCHSYYFSKQVNGVVTAYDFLNDEEINIVVIYVLILYNCNYSSQYVVSIIN